MPRLSIGALSLYYEHIQGIDPAFPPILFVHGLGSCSQDWPLQVPAFRARHSVILLDLRGHGLSDKPPGPYTIGQMAADVAGMLDPLGIARIDWVGLSLGGCVGLQFALDYPDRVRRLVLVNSFAALRPAGVRGVVKLAGRAVRYRLGGMQRMAEYVARDLFPAEGQEELVRLTTNRLMSNDQNAYRAATGAVVRFDVRHRLDEVTAPTLVIAGSEDHTVSLESKQLLASRIPDARLVVIRDSGHATPYDQPEAFNRLVLEFLEAQGD